MTLKSRKNILHKRAIFKLKIILIREILFRRDLKNIHFLLFDQKMKLIFLLYNIVCGQFYQFTLNYTITVSNQITNSLLQEITEDICSGFYHCFTKFVGYGRFSPDFQEIPDPPAEANCTDAVFRIYRTSLRFLRPILKH